MLARNSIKTDLIHADRRGLTFWIQWAVATLELQAILILFAFLKTNGLGDQYKALMAITFFASIPIYSSFRVYEKNIGYAAGCARLMAGWLVLLGILVAISFITKTSASFSREVMLQWLVLGAIAQVISFLCLHKLSQRYQASLRKKNKVIIVGINDGALKLAEKLTRTLGEQMCGLVLTEAGSAKPDLTPVYPVLGCVEQLRTLIKEYRITRLYIALPLSEAEQIEGLYVDLLDMHVDVIWVPDLADMKLLNHSISSIAGMPAINLNESPLTTYPTAIMAKAIIDRILAFCALVAFSPIMLGVAIAIKLTSRGPIVFKQLRHGCDGLIIEVWKFRSMRMHDDKEVTQATREDPRITPIGRFIRRTSIDELPQFFNVLQGRMSLVGPRPHAVAHNDYYSDKISAYMARHRIKPGITGLAQISGYRGETDTLDKMQKRVNFDLEYINHWSLWLDIKILIKTPLSLLAKDIY